jgi:cytochrome c2
VCARLSRHRTDRICAASMADLPALFKGFVYSVAFLKSLKGMEWTDASLDVWITNPQKWVPGVYMFYKQSDPEVRRKIILYLKAN